MILKLADAIEEHADGIAELESANAGKPLHAFKDDEIPVIVFDDVDLDTAVLETIAGTGHYNAGQDCTAATRVLAAGKVYDDVVPHGGFKQSGYGKDLSAYSIEDYTVVKHVMASLA